MAQAGAYGAQPYGAQPYGAQMSQQATTSMLMSNAKVNPRLQQLMDADPNNKECADCSAQNPTWASYNIGVFVCEKCVGIHRRIGTHISKPRSIDLDEWGAEHLEAMEVVGNTNAEAYWCYNVPIGRSKPEEGDAMVIITDWIQKKYEQKEFCKKPGSTNERTDPGVVAYEKSGFMDKSSGAKEGGKWQKRWFELKDFQLAYYGKPPEPGKKNTPKGIISITPQVMISCATGMGVGGEEAQDRMVEGTGFIVRDPSKGRDYNFRTDTPEELVDWVIKLRGVKAYANTQNARQATDTAFSSYMLKQGGKGVVKWQQRWVVLKANGDILYYKDNKTNHPQGQLRLQGACVRMTPLRDYCFEFTDYSRAKGPVVMAAESEALYQQWRQALKQWMVA